MVRPSLMSLGEGKMLNLVIFSGKRFQVASHWNGLAYTITALSDQASIYLQGDDAADFREQWESAETASPDRLIDDIIGQLTEDFFAVPL
jgi:hypothetical protein